MIKNLAVVQLGQSGPAPPAQLLSEAQKAKMAQVVRVDYTWHVVNTDVHTPYYLPVTKQFKTCIRML